MKENSINIINIQLITCGYGETVFAGIFAISANLSFIAFKFINLTYTNLMKRFYLKFKY